MLTASNVSDRSASPASPVNSKPGSPVSRGDTTSDVSTPEDLRGAARAAPAAICDSSVDSEIKNNADT